MEPVAGTVPDDAARIIAHVADATAKKYAAFTTRDDIFQELWLYYVDNSKRFEKWRMSGQSGDTFRLMRGLFGKAKLYCETEKAVKSGYNIEDVYWYEPAQLANLVPLALNPRWDGLSGAEEDPGMPRGKSPASESGNLLAMVMDIRRVVRPFHRAADFDPATEVGEANLEWLSQRLGGGYPKAPGYEPASRRKVLSNAAAVAKTEAGY